jgi:hypothetical protein
VLGGEPDWNLLGTLTGQPDAEVLAALRDAADLQLLAIGSDGELRWRHALTRDAVLATLLPPERGRDRA